MAEKRDYYEVLGVSKTATPDEIKSAFRKKAKACHPDLHPDDKNAEAQFKELNEANEVLSDPEKRKRYDQYGFNDPMAGGSPFGGGTGGFDFGGMGFDSIFDMFTGGMGGSSARRRNAPVQGNDLQQEVHITFEEAAFGCKKTIDFSRRENCNTCNGTGAKPGTQPETCTTCGGAGQIRSQNGWMSTVRTCPVCGGEGTVVKERCPDCAGRGRVLKRRHTEVTIPAGIDDGQTLVMRGEGEPGMRGGPSGDLYITVMVREHKLFKRDGYDLYLDLPISFTQAALGAEVDIPTLESPVKQKIPEGTQNDTEILLKGKGIQRLRGAGRGNLIVRVKVEVPRRLNEKQKELLRKFDETATGHEYDSRKTFMNRVKELFEK